MNETPRTDAAIYPIKVGNESMTLATFARKLEREGDQLAKQCAKNVEEIGQLRAELEAETKRRLGAEACLKSWKEDEGADAARLDWLVQFGHKGLVDLADQNIFITRESIDIAMEPQNDET